LYGFIVPPIARFFYASLKIAEVFFFSAEQKISKIGFRDGKKTTALWRVWWQGPTLQNVLIQL
jgi:hypothetical protein